MGFGGDPSQQAGACRSLKGLARAKSRGLDSIEHVGQELLPGTREMGKLRHICWGLCFWYNIRRKEMDDMRNAAFILAVLVGALGQKEER